MRRMIALCFAVLLFTCWGLPAQAQSLPETFAQRLQAYEGYVSTLRHVTQKADAVEDHQSPEYLEIYTQGHFFKDRMAKEYRRLKADIKDNPEATMEYLRRQVAADPSGRRFDVLKKLYGYNLRVLKAKNPSLNVTEYLPHRPQVSPAHPSQNLFFSLEDAPNPQIVPSAEPSPQAMREFEQHFSALARSVETPAAFSGYGTEAGSHPQFADAPLGWVSGQFARREGNEVVITASQMNVRGGPSTDHAVVAQARSGQRYEFVKEENGWFQIKLTGGSAPTPTGTGYCKITMVKGNVPFLVQMDDFLRPKEIVLTFDDGPTAQDGRSEAIINTLRDAKMSAVFFCLGNTLKQAYAAPLVKLMRAAGSFPAVHGFYHATSDGKPFTAIPWETVRSHLQQTKDLIKGITGEEAVFFRPPYGIIRADDRHRIESELKLIPVGWTIDSLDWSTKSDAELFTKITGMIAKRGKGILLMHDIHAQSRLVVPRLVTWLKQNGYTVVGPERLMDAFTAARR